MNQCDHTLHLTDADGRPIGSWHEEPTREGVRLACRRYGRLFGYRLNATAAARQERMWRAYVEQQRRMNCPGCGDEPFLG